MLFRFALAAVLALPPQSAHETRRPHAGGPEHVQGGVATLPANGQPARIPFRFEGQQVRVDATVGGKGPIRLVLDTGMPMEGLLLYRNARVEALGLSAEASPVLVAGVGGDGTGSQAQMASGLDVVLGDMRIDGTTALLVDPAPGFPPGIDGIIGGSLFFHHVVRIDMEQDRLEVSAPAGWSPPEGGCVVPLVRERGFAFVDLRVAVGDGDPIPARVVVDIGAGHPLSLDQAEDGRFAPPAGSIEAPLGRGMSGVILGRVGRVRRVELGSFAFEGVVTTFPARKPGKGGRSDGATFRDGNLGEEILRRFHATFDYEGGRLVLEKAGAFGDPFEREMAGLAFDWQADGTASVRSVLAGSPAATSGIQPGDRLLAIDGKAMTEIGENGLRASLQVDGAERVLTIRRGEATVEKRVRLKRLV